MEFGWWAKDDEGRKFQICADVFGRYITWRRKQGHHQPWEAYPPSEQDWERLVAEAERRLPRRLLSKKQYELIKSRGQ
ncbi:MAG: hypothetical protein PHQ04_08355 [Opitutaceae bacterium]|nr:hypothetical protein [Opitutaceae bacterium]